jgi:hypothetical protein
MSEAFEYVSHARLLYKDGYRNACLGEVATPVVYGVQVRAQDSF